VAGGESLEDEDDVAGLSAVWREIADAAPSPDESAEMIRTSRDALATYV